MNLYLVRHTTPNVPPNTCYGQADVDVTDSFAEEFAKLLPKLSHIPSPVVYSSPLQRCHKLAQAYAETRGLKVNTDDRLKELHFGDWEMQSWDNIPRGVIDVWAQEHVTQAPPGGESFDAMHARNKAFLDELIKPSEATVNKPQTEASAATFDPNHAHVIIFTHAGVIRALVAEALQLPLMHAFRLNVNYGSVTQLIVEPSHIRLGYLNL